MINGQLLQILRQLNLLLKGSCRKNCDNCLNLWNGKKNVWWPPILVSEAEIAKRRRITADTLASFAVDNIPVNPKIQYIFDDFVEGKIATSAEVKALLLNHYSKIAKLSKPW